MKKYFENAIIGGGIIGTSILYHLAKSGNTNCILLEKEDMLGTGSTGRSVGGIRCQFSEPANIKMTIESMEILKHLEEEAQTELDFKRNGYLLMASEESTMKDLSGISELLSSLGIRQNLLDSEGLKKRYPYLNTQDLIGGLLTPDDGFLDPHGILYGFSRIAKKLGAIIKTSADVVNIRKEKDGMFTLCLSSGEAINCRNVINAAGPWAGKVARLASLEIPVTLFKRNVFITAPTTIVPKNTPMTIDFDNPFYFRPESGGLLLSAADKNETGEVDCTLDLESLPIMVEKAINRVPKLEETEIVTGWAGVRTLTPDQNAIIGESPELSGFYFAAGFSGHGIMHSASAGKLLSEIINGKNIDWVRADVFNLERFNKKFALSEKGVI